MTKKQDFYPLPGYPLDKKFTSLADISEYLHGEKITCLICGRSYKGLAGHISKHGISADEYKERFGLPYKTGLTSNSTKETLKKNGLNNLSHLDSIRSLIDRVAQAESSKRQRISVSKTLQAKMNVSKAPVCESPFSVEDAITIFKHMVDFNTSLNDAVKSTGIMKMTAFWKLLERHHDEIGHEYETARSFVSKGVTNPLIKRADVITDVREQRMAGVPRKIIAEKYGIHEEYVSILCRGHRNKAQTKQNEASNGN